MASTHNSNALLLFRVGPVLCAAPSLAVVGIITPPALTRTPGSDDAQPGMFRHEQRLVTVQDLRVRFGVAPRDRDAAGRLVISETGAGGFGFWVDGVLDVIAWPEKGCGRQGRSGFQLEHDLAGQVFHTTDAGAVVAALGLVEGRIHPGQDLVQVGAVGGGLAHGDGGAEVQ